MLFRSLLYLALRTSDTLSLTVGDVREKYRINFKEEKTGKTKVIEIHPDLREEYEEYTKNKADDEPLFPSQMKDTKQVK